MILLYIFLATAFVCLLMARINSIEEAMTTWNYYVYRYKNYCAVNYTEQEKPECRINANEITRADAILVFLMFWKIDSNNYFDFKPDYDEINELYNHK